MEYPLEIRLKSTSRHPHLSIADAGGQPILFLEQRSLEMETTLLVYSNTERNQPVYTINPDWILDFSAQYHFTDQDGKLLGSVRRDGERSMWRVRFEIMNGGPPNLRIQEENPWAKFMDALVGEIPLVGAVIPRLVYLVRAEDERTVVRLEKQPALFESRYRIDKQTELNGSEETRVLLSLLILVLSEQVSI
ncbi:MAG: hypothetical protein ACE5MM_05500 [Nitrospiraceae bacterium]